ncbi:MAG: IS66 family insertion sequence element accessory protein TnpB [Planctomycetia bacterium]|nr:IS66 family insertion sequence element accessory protein TnpB [Planctomycetia bacterium]
MLSIAPPPTIYLHSGATDMRKSFDGLSGIIRGTFGGDPADGSLFLFVNKRRDRIKALWWDGDGFVLWYKRLEQGTFETVPARGSEDLCRVRRAAGDRLRLARDLGSGPAKADRATRWNPQARLPEGS